MGEMKVTVNVGWFVHGMNEQDADNEKIKAWIATHPERTRWEPDTFERLFVQSGEFIADDSDPYCGGGSLMLFRTKESAERYSECDPAIASGVRRIERVLYAKAPPVEDEQLEVLSDALSAAANERGGIAAFYNLGILVTSDDNDGSNAIRVLASGLDVSESEIDFIRDS